jgi:hypothetical protein
MKNPHPEASPTDLPITHNLTLAYVGSLIIAVLMAIASVAGLVSPEQLYPTEELRRSFIPTDVINLVIGLPILLGSMWFARRSRLLGLLFWPGALFYVLYHYIVYTFGLPLNVGFLLALLLLALSAYTMAGLIASIASIEGKAIQQRLSGAVSERITGGVLTGLGILFTLRTLGVIGGALVDPTALPQAELALQVADFITTFAWIIGGVLLWRREPLGYVVGAGLLFQASMLFVGLLIYFALQPVLTATPFPLTDFVAISVMGLIVFVPFGLFVRGIVSQKL